MNSGKSIEVLRTAHNYEEQGKTVMLFTPAVDNRYGEGVITSRIGIQRSAVIITEKTDLFRLAEEGKPDCVLVDEAQFLTREQVLALCEIVDELGIPAIAYGLRADFRGELFPGSYHLLALADKIEEIKTVCWQCRRKATMNMRLHNGKPVFEGEQILIGGNESYLPVCRRCYSTARKQAKDKTQ
jgi:thymidine kinase